MLLVSIPVTILSSPKHSPIASQYVPYDQITEKEMVSARFAAILHTIPVPLGYGQLPHCNSFLEQLWNTLLKWELHSDEKFKQRTNFAQRRVAQMHDCLLTNDLQPMDWLDGQIFEKIMREKWWEKILEEKYVALPLWLTKDVKILYFTQMLIK